jgi:hypothetical protein
MEGGLFMAKDKVMCPLCGSEVTKKTFQVHFETEKYVLDRIAKEHPDWKESDGSCTKCLEYYVSLGE